MKPSTQALRRPSGPPEAANRRSQGRKPTPASHHHPLQLELFGQTHPGLPRGRQDTQPVPRPSVVPHPDAPRLELQRALNRLTGGRLASLVLTDNRRTILTVKAGRPGDRSQLCLRIHRSFVGAPPEALEAVAAFLESRKGSDRSRAALAVIRQHFHQHHPERRTRQTTLRPEGTMYDLREIVADLNRRYFGDRLAVGVTWGRSSGGAAHHCRRRRTSSLQLGSYSYEERLIRLHGVLDQPTIPRFVIEAIIFHELLHADMPPVVRHGRRYVHTPEFRRREREYRHLDKANRWIQEHLPELLRARAKASPRRRRA